MSGHGVIVELSNDQLRVSDFTEQSLRVFPNCNNHLGQFCEIGVRKKCKYVHASETSQRRSRSHCRRSNGEIHSLKKLLKHTSVICAKSDTLSDAPLKEKYADSASSPYFGFGGDPKGMMLDRIQKKRRHEATVVYFFNRGRNLQCC
ncbi:hypothetical protein CAEBREN_18793 [Caenorhabditis brenneri]|uniref:Uncharacterized protein n=1 Tax=Caenorhabditis brenneri TaxID=135651 RepID=G0P365_CAEBE|nr:hypothetical protein CAEBREN_18793 [Caenorhabditis brenneri]